MTFYTADNQKGRFDEPSPEAISWEWQQQLTAYAQLCRMLAGATAGQPRVAEIRGGLPGKHAA